MATTELTKASDALAFARLGHLQIAILDIDIHTAQLIRRVLGTMGITRTHLSRNSNDMLAILKDHPVDILIAEWDSRPENGIDLTRRLRAADSPNRMIPIILTTSRTTTSEFQLGIDAGANEIVVKPFNMRKILNTILRIVDQPRPFILAKSFVGPDRRRGRKAPPHIQNMRRPTPPTVIHKTAVNEIFVDDTPRLVLPDYSLKKKLESSVAQMAGIEHLLPHAEATKRSEDYVQWMLKDTLTLKQSYKNLLAAPEHTRLSMERISDASVSIRARGVRSGYTLAARAATGLHDFCQKWMDPKNPNHLIIVEKYIETIQAILNANLVGGDSPVGRALMNELQLLVKKYI